MRRLMLTGGFALLASSLAAQPVDHQAAPMMAPAQPPVTHERWVELHADTPPQRTRSSASVREEFATRYQRQESPRLAVLWDRSFDDRLSDWQADRRSTLSREGQSAEVRTGVNAGTQERRGSSTQQWQDERRVIDHSQGAERDPRVRNGLLQSLSQSGVRVVDRAVLMRIADRERTESRSLSAAPDVQRVETSALLDHADYLIEVSSVAGQPGVWEIHARSLSDGRVITRFRSSGEPPEHERTSSWVATSRGYEKREASVSPEERGEEIALAIMEALSASWRP